VGDRDNDILNGNMIVHCELRKNMDKQLLSSN
jgi:hypothetical protein